MQNPRLSFIATRIGGVERYRFADLPHVLTIEPAGRSFDVGCLRFASHAAAFADVLATATYMIEQLQRRH